MIEEETTAADLCSRDRFAHPRQAIPRRVAPQHSSSPFRLTEDVRSQMESAPCGFQCYQFDAFTISGELHWHDLGPTVNITGDTLVVQLSSESGGFVAADATRIELQETGAVREQRLSDIRLAFHQYHNVFGQFPIDGFFPSFVD